MELPKMEDVMGRLENNTPPPLHMVKIDLHALMHAALIHALNKRQDRLVRPKRLRRGHLVMGVNPYKGRHVIGRVKRAQYKNASKGKRVYVRAHHGGHF